MELAVLLAKANKIFTKSGKSPLGISPLMLISVGTIIDGVFSRGDRKGQPREVELFVGFAAGNSKDSSFENFGVAYRPFPKDGLRPMLYASTNDSPTVKVGKFRMAHETGNRRLSAWAIREDGRDRHTHAAYLAQLENGVAIWTAWKAKVAALAPTINETLVESPYGGLLPSSTNVDDLKKLLKPLRFKAQPKAAKPGKVAASSKKIELTESAQADLDAAIMAELAKQGLV